MTFLRRLLGSQPRRPAGPPGEDHPFVYVGPVDRTRSNAVANVVHARTRTGTKWHRVDFVDYSFVGHTEPWLAGHGRSIAFACGGAVFDHEPLEGGGFTPTPFVGDLPEGGELCKGCRAALARRAAAHARGRASGR